MALQKAKKDSTSTAFKFVEAGDTLKGYYQGQVTKTINGSPAVEHTYKTTKGLFGVLGQANILNQLKNNGINPGTYVEITFTGNVQRLKNGRTMKVYDVSFDPENLDSNATAPTLEASDESDEGLFEDAPEMDEAPVVRAAPKVTATTPDAAKRARLQAMLNSSK
jgi:hypothetical protein